MAAASLSANFRHQFAESRLPLPALELALADANLGGDLNIGQLVLGDQLGGLDPPSGPAKNTDIY
jgi:hypothetical protein